jgi:hypothetical protein
MNKVINTIYSFLFPALFLIGLGYVAWQFPVEFRLDVFVGELVVTAVFAWIYGALRNEEEFETHFFALTVFVLPFAFFLYSDNYDGGFTVLLALIAFKTLGGFRKIFKMINFFFRVRFSKI